MATATVSASVNADVKRAVGITLSNAGVTANEVIKALWDHIALTGAIPSFDAKPAADAAEESPLFDQLMNLRANVNAPKEFSALDRAGLKAILEERDV